MEMITVPWRPTLRGGQLGSYVQTTLPKAEYDELQELLNTKRHAAFHEIRNRMDIWALFPGTALTDYVRAPLPAPVPVEARIEDEAQASLDDVLPDPGRNEIGKFHGPGAGAPSTEREAAIEQYPRSGTARRRVLDYIASAGDDGATDEEAALALDMRLYTAAPRRNELLNTGWIYDTGRSRRTTTGSKAVVWALTSTGRRQHPLLPTPAPVAPRGPLPASVPLPF